MLLVLWEVCFDYFDTDRDQGRNAVSSPLATFKDSDSGLEADEYPVYSDFSTEMLLNPLSKRLTILTDYLKLRSNRNASDVGSPNSNSVSLRWSTAPRARIALSRYREPSTSVAIELVQADIDRKVALEIADREWDFISPRKVAPPRHLLPILPPYVAEKIEMSLVRNSREKSEAVYIIEAIRENYQDRAGAKENVGAREQRKREEKST